MGRGSGARTGLRSFLGLGSVGGTLTVVALEFALLTAVYQSDNGPDRRHEAWTRLDGVESAWRPGQPAGAVEAAAQGLADVAGDDADPVLTSVAAWAADPDAARFAELRTTTATLGDRLAAAQRAADVRARIGHGTLLALASVGWFLWFRRVVRRQRRLERDLTKARAVSAGERRLTALVRNSADVVMVVEPDTTVSFASPSTRSVLGREPEDVVGLPVGQLVEESDVPLLTGLLVRSGHGDHGVILHARHADGRALVLEGTLTNLLADDSVNGWLLTVRDVTGRIALQEELAHQAMHDSLTGLANRQLFSERLTHALRRRGGDVPPLALLFMDVDDFKDVNDARGHGVGDQLLVEFGRRVSATIREGDTAARLGGDEFAVLMEDSDLETAHAVAEQLVSALAAPLRAGDVELPVRASIGVATAVPGETSAEEALRNADVAMYFAKDRGKGTVAIYDSELHATALRRLELHRELSRAVPDDELLLHYQPTLDLGTGEVTGFEALVRWQHPTRGLLQPGEFVTAAEQSGLIVPIGRWVLTEACQAAATELRLQDHAPVMAVNVAARQLAEPGFRDEVVDALRASGLPAHRLRLEITESTLLDDRDRVVEVLTELRALGVCIAIDDFGTGYSSLSYLAELPVDVLKVDKSFVDHVCDGGGSLVEAILTLSRSLHLRTVAEGVETPEQAAWLRAAGCDAGQGYLWSRPVPLADARRLLVDRRATRGDVPTDGPDGSGAEVDGVLDLTAG